MNLRKDNMIRLTASNTVGIIQSMNKKNNQIVLDGDRTITFDDQIEKISKKEYTEILNAAAENAEPEQPTRKISVAQLSRDMFVEMTLNPENKRKHVIAAFEAVLGLTNQGAKTYYYNCTTARKNGKL